MLRTVWDQEAGETRSSSCTGTRAQESGGLALSKDSGMDENPAYKRPLQAKRQRVFRGILSHTTRDVRPFLAKYLGN